MTTTAEAVLIAHQRRDFGSCFCGWSELGRSHAGHQERMLVEAGLIAAGLAVEQPGAGDAFARFGEALDRWVERAGPGAGDYVQFRPEEIRQMVREVSADLGLPGAERPVR